MNPRLKSVARDLGEACQAQVMGEVEIKKELDNCVQEILNGNFQDGDQTGNLSSILWNFANRMGMKVKMQRKIEAQTDRAVANVVKEIVKEDEVKNCYQSAQIAICSNHEECKVRPGIDVTADFTATEVINVVKGLRLYENIFTGSEISKLKNFVDELRTAGQEDKLTGDTFVLYNKNIEGGKREYIQLGVPIHEAPQQIQKRIQPLPPFIQDLINHLMLWNLLPKQRNPNSCVIRYFDEGEFSSPFVKPPYLEAYIATLVLADSNIAFGHALPCDEVGNYRGALVLSIKEGSIVVMKGNCLDVSNHAICASSNRRVSVSFFCVRRK
ncbi:hypothetical protein ACP275_04G027500 [Erythranthe tilingii]